MLPPVTPVEFVGQIQLDQASSRGSGFVFRRIWSVCSIHLDVLAFLYGYFQVPRGEIYIVMHCPYCFIGSFGRIIRKVLLCPNVLFWTYIYDFRIFLIDNCWGTDKYRLKYRAPLFLWRSLGEILLRLFLFILKNSH